MLKKLMPGRIWWPKYCARYFSVQRFMCRMQGSGTLAETQEKFSVGIEEEYLLIDPETRDLVADPSDDVFKDCETAIDPDIGGVRPEFLRGQIEVGTAVCYSIDEARTQL